MAARRAMGELELTKAELARARRPPARARACRRRRRRRRNSSPACQLAVLAPAVPLLFLGQPDGLCERRAVIIIIEHKDVRCCLAARARPVHLVVLAPKEEVIFI